MSMRILLLWLLLAASAHAFTVPQRRALKRTTLSQLELAIHLPEAITTCITQNTAVVTQQAIQPAIAWTLASLQSGPYAPLAATAVSFAVLFPLTQIRNLYGISVGYGLSVAAIGAVLQYAFFGSIIAAKDSIPGLLVQAMIFYGLRLGMYLWIRQLAGWKPGRSRPEPARIKRIPFALSLALFYAFMTTPAVYALRNVVPVELERVAWTGVGMAWTGAVLEAIADLQKFVVKMRYPDEKEFKGPSTGVYAITRHPNYTGEILFWLGVFVAGAPSFGKSAVAWVCSTLGLYGIVNIMFKASAGLEKRQAEKYGGQNDYELWKINTRAPLIPFFNSKK